MASAYDQRAFNTFDAKSQAALRAGGTITGGDGRRFVLINGHATTVGSATYREGMAQRAQNAANQPNTSLDDIRRATGNPNAGDVNGIGTIGDSMKVPVGPGQVVPLDPSGNPVPSGPSGGGGPASGGYDPVAEAEKRRQEEIAAANAARQRDARARITSVLAEYGLESLGDFVWQQILGGKSDAEVLQDLRNTPEFKKRFPAIAERTKRGLAAISPGEYVAYERQARQLMRANGIPEGFYDSNDDFTNYLNNDVSVAELNDRVQLGKQASFEAPQDVRDALVRDYGVSEGGLTAFFLDPDKATPLLEKAYRSSQVGGAATRTGFGITSRAENERLVGLGVTAGQAQEGFSQLSEQRQLFDPLPGQSGQDTINRTDQLGAAFEGNANARRRIEKKRRERGAVFEGGGSYVAGQAGVSGLADTSRR